MLGRGTHEVWVLDKEGHRIGQLTEVLSVQWNRVRDDFSSARVLVENPSIECCEMLANLRTIRNELLITRNGKQVWEGVVSYLNFSVDQVEVEARDLAWMLRRVALKKDYDFTGTKARAGTLALEQIVNDHRAQVGRGLTVVRLASTGEARTAAEHAAWSTSVGALVDDYAENRGIDYAVVGHNLVLWDTHLRHTTLPLLDDSYLSGPMSVSEYGAELATRTIRRGQGKVTITTGPQQWVDYYGLVDAVVNVTEEDDDAPGVGEDIIIEQEKGRLDDRTPAPQAVLMPANTTLLPETPVDIEQLVPGAWAPLQSTMTCRRVRSWAKLNQVSVVEDRDGEFVNVTFDKAPSEMVVP